MHKLYELKEKLIKELGEYGSKEMSSGSLDVIDKLAHAAKNVGKVIECCEEEEYSNAYYGYDGNSYYSDMSYADEQSMSYDPRNNYVRPDGSYRDGGMSHARGRGRYAKRDSMGRYSRASEDIKHELQELMSKATDERTKDEIRKLMDRM